MFEVEIIMIVGVAAILICTAFVGSSADFRRLIENCPEAFSKVPLHHSQLLTKHLLPAFKRCSRSDPNFEACFFEAVDESATVLKNGETKCSLRHLKS
jgi:hypothetical protein